MTSLKGVFYLQPYFIMRPKQGLILDENLTWKKFGDCAENSGLAAALGLEMDDAVRIASWLSYDGVTAITYPESTMISNAEKEMGESFRIAVCPLTHAGLESKTRDGIYPAFLMRKPANKMEKKMLFRQLEKKTPETQKSASEIFVGVTKKEMGKNEIICKGDDSVYYIVKSKKAMFLTKALTWIGIDEIRRDKKQLSQLFAIKDDIVQAQNVCQWVAASGETVNPCTSSSLKRRFNISFPNAVEDIISEIKARNAKGTMVE